jgi:phosphoribosylformylglycinamidine synthase subunit PurQ / glutaminase
VVNARIPWTAGFAGGELLTVPVKNGEGAFVAEEATLDELERAGQVVVRYADGAPNGSARDIAGICNAEGNVFGLMPHPEHAIDPLTGPSSDGLGFFTSLVSRGGDPPYPPMRDPARPIAKTAIVSGARDRANGQAASEEAW